MRNKNICYRNRRADLLVMFGGVCKTCGETQDLEFAHMEPTECVGKGRGFNNRVMDVEQHPEAYTLLCTVCHDLLDGRPVRRRQTEILRHHELHRND